MLKIRALTSIALTSLTLYSPVFAGTILPLPQHYCLESTETDQDKILLVVNREASQITKYRNRAANPAQKPVYFENPITVTGEDGSVDLHYRIITQAPDEDRPDTEKFRINHVSEGKMSFQLHEAELTGNKFFELITTETMMNQYLKKHPTEAGKYVIEKTAGPKATVPVKRTFRFLKTGAECPLSLN